ncbi:PIN domain-containing protein [Streptomyces chryseus]|uniref:Ribonuclease VapC n=1 Tax=Streptomyces chryseus TaxID=68186 RepID=A0ABQ3DF78_9ACTN|nr:PIN domain-containing protein [Streptomyces chryseus]GGX12234.1 ribonuclease VapC [Streptomyces chryseus]GHA86087.1 ribonuclease VapC [Streptomyces chryseus]
MTDHVIPVAIADTNALFRLFTASSKRHEEHREALSRIGHLIVSPMVLAELDYLLTQKINASTAATALEFIAKRADAQRFEVPAVQPHLHTALAIMNGYRDLDGGSGIGLADAMNVALAAHYRTAALFTSDIHFRIVRPLDAHESFRLLPDDL